MQILDDPYGTGGPTAYLNRAAFTSPATGHLQHADAVHHREPEQLPERLRADADVQDRAARRSMQVRWEVFNVINHVNFNAPVTALNSASFGQILTAGDPRIMQFALKFTF